MGVKRRLIIDILSGPACLRIFSPIHFLFRNLTNCTYKATGFQILDRQPARNATHSVADGSVEQVFNVQAVRSQNKSNLPLTTRYTRRQLSPWGNTIQKYFILFLACQSLKRLAFLVTLELSNCYQFSNIHYVQLLNTHAFSNYRYTQIIKKV